MKAASTGGGAKSGMSAEKCGSNRHVNRLVLKRPPGQEELDTLREEKKRWTSNRKRPLDQGRFMDTKNLRPTGGASQGSSISSQDRKKTTGRCGGVHPQIGQGSIGVLLTQSREMYTLNKNRGGQKDTGNENHFTRRKVANEGLFDGGGANP